MPISSEQRPSHSPSTTATSDVGELSNLRVIVENPTPAIDGGRFPIKRTVGESVQVTADVFADGHDLLTGVLKYRRVSASGERPDEWLEVPLVALGNDAWSASFAVTELGVYEYTIEAWVDGFGTWLAGLIAKAEAGQDVSSELVEGADLVQAAVRADSLSDSRARLKPDTTHDATVRLKPDTTYAKVRLKPDTTHDATVRLKPDTTYDATVRLKPDTTYDAPYDLQKVADLLRGSKRPQEERVAAARDPELRRIMGTRADRATATSYMPPLTVIVDSPQARFSAWYEMFPRSSTPDPSRSGTWRDAEARLADIAAMGFDVLYLPPIHPIGRTNRKGRNNALTAAPGDPGSPWAIGSEDGGHMSIEPGLGTFDDFHRFVAVANRLGLEIALDIAFQASPDHPWVREHPAVVQASSRRIDQVRREPAQEVSGHLSVRLRQPGLALALGRAPRRLRVLDFARCPDLPRGQSSYEVVPILGMVHRRHQARASRRDLPG